MIRASPLIVFIFFKADDGKMRRRAEVKRVPADGYLSQFKSRLSSSMELFIAMSLFRRVRQRMDKSGKQVT